MNGRRRGRYPRRSYLVTMHEYWTHTDTQVHTDTHTQIEIHRQRMATSYQLHFLARVTPVAIGPGRQHLRSVARSDFIIPRSRTKSGSRAFSIAGPCGSVRQFKRTLKAPEADLGMFSMFGRTGAPTKMGPPQEDQKNFCNVPTHRNCPKVIEVINKIKIL